MKTVMICVLTLSVMFGCKIADTAPPTAQPSVSSGINTVSEGEMISGVAFVSADTAALDVVNNPAFAGFGRFLLPTERGLPNSGMALSNINALLPYHNNISADTTVSVVNYMLEETARGKTVFYDIYTAEEKQADPTKQNTGLFFFRGKPDAPFAIVCAGGGFSYVGSIHESFPLALELSKRGYNAFAIQYRTGGADAACEDLAAAISFVFENAETLGVSTDDYSLWGGSAGARMAAYLGSYGSAGYGGDDLPRPGTVIMQYTGHTDYTKNDPPTFVVVGENDGIANWRTMEQRVNNLKAAGIDTEFHKYPNLGHGFGLGIGTTAEGWLYDATRFWEKHMIKATPVTDRQPVPQELVNIPEAYYQAAKQQGALAELSYNTYESKTYEQKSMALTKRAIVYLPYGYSEERNYNVFYLMHGGWGNETSTLGTPNRPNPFKNVIDNAIENGDIEPLIIVCPTYNNTSSEDSASFGLALELNRNYHNELINDLVPAVESKYSTYAESPSPQGLMQSRDHRGFGGFSMGSVATWRTFQYGLDYFRYFLPMSCGTSLDEENIFAAAKNHDQSDYFVWVITGTEDFAYRYDENRVEHMRNSPYFTESDNAQNGNFAYRVKDGYSHDGLAAMEYTYNGLLWFWNQ
jgi:acetyl esterase/lipase